MYIPNDNKQIYNIRLQSLVGNWGDTKLIEPSNQNSIKIPKVVWPTNKKMFLLTVAE